MCRNVSKADSFASSEISAGRQSINESTADKPSMKTDIPSIYINGADWRKVVPHRADRTGETCVRRGD